MPKGGFIYVLTNQSHTVLYTGVTSNLANRVHQHNTGAFKNAFTSKYNTNILVYYEVFDRIEDAITREKQLKAGSRQKKIELIQKTNPEWKELKAPIYYL
jgi:putative endonuclease